MNQTITRRAGIAGAAQAQGPTLVIDTFRAFSTAAYLFAAGVDQVMLTDSLDEARALAGRLEGTLLCGESDGIQPADFDLGNSPSQVLERTDLTGKHIVMRTSSGTRSAIAAVRAGAFPVYATSLVIATATARAVAAAPAVTIVAAGLNGVEPADEDDATADLLESRLTGRYVDTASMIGALRSGSGANRLLTTPTIDDRDLELCLAVDSFDFALRVAERDGLLLLEQD
jgi:2-phosphosulfolactate phosphatase